MDLSSLFEKQLLVDPIHSVHKNFIIIGAGGTGGYLIPNLARILSLRNKERLVEGLKPHKLTIVDGDIVELKNLTRQQFVQPDINKNKAEVMARRYGSAFELQISYVSSFIDSPELLVQMMSEDDGIPFLVDCVDNNKTRMLMVEAIERYSSMNVCFFLSSGNEEHTGQVIFSQHGERSFAYRMKMAERHGGSKLVANFSSPSIADIFPSTANGEDKLPTEESCAEQSVSAPQNIHTNMTAANILFGFLNKMLQRDATLDHFAVFFNTQNSSTRVFYNSKTDMKNALAMTADNASAPFFLEDAGHRLRFREESGVGIVKTATYQSPF